MPKPAKRQIIADREIAGITKCVLEAEIERILSRDQNADNQRNNSSSTELHEDIALRTTPVSLYMMLFITLYSTSVIFEQNTFNDDNIRIVCKFNNAVCARAQAARPRGRRVESLGYVTEVIFLILKCPNMDVAWLDRLGAFNLQVSLTRAFNVIEGTKHGLR
ncbi:hypothetical protein EJ05DRAFT_536436 [Pseudovirgaria hyperparasitica]|uniref:Uncharacterized protein n=1 Tax=Pseudovirgaria hyperparasitica TaxID=470096 RepID=A0A6A6WEJ7_9PEZI|nr:uncharacterized protein EJ05DRAFT_536436 [Pseudovirgaria hyperparasitica]KAF2760306.1 hypothetical protein EJ05DRAFT_536436 [Pseudovirgaria hyperparasitica]